MQYYFIMFKEQAEQTLKNNGQKLTKSRLQIISFLEHIHEPVSPYDIQKKQPELDVVSIYRTFEILEKHGLIHKIWSLGWYVKCSLVESINWNHSDCHEFQVCQQCNSYNEIKVHHHHEKASNNDFITKQHVSEQIGVCKKCSH